MKRSYRIISFILVLSLCFTSLVFTAGAEETAAQDEYYVDENAEVYTPSANYTPITEENVTNILNQMKASGAEIGSIGTSAIFGGSNLNAYLVNSDTCESYVMLVPTKTTIQNGKVTDHVQFNTMLDQNFKYDASNPTYFIYEMDVATESGILPIFYQVVARNHDGVKVNGATVDAWGSSWQPHVTDNSLYMLMTPGVFHHITFIGDVDNNTLYIYMDNQLVATQTNGITSNAMFEQYKNNGAKIRIDGFRIQINDGVKLNGNMSYCFKDMYQALLTGAESGNLQDYVGKPTLHGWSGNRYEGHADNKLPSLIKVNGTEYNNTTDASNALNSYRENNEASLMRSVLSGDITVDCDGLIHTYSAEVSLKQGPNTTLTKVDGSTWKATIHTPKSSTQLVVSNKGGNLFQYLGYNLAGNLITEIALQNYGKADTVNADIMKSDKGNEYMYIYDNSENAYNGSNHFYLNASLPLTKENTIDGHEFIVYDFDIYSESEFIKVYNNFIPRSITTDPSRNNKPLASTSFFLSSDGSASDEIKVESGIWNHFTFVGEVSTGKAYVYINNVLIKTITNGLYTPVVQNGVTYARDGSGNLYTLDEVCINMFRCMQIAAGKSADSVNANTSVCVDNFDARFVDGDPTLIPGMQNLSGWVTNLYGNGYQFKELPAIATVDGVEYYDVFSLTDALTPAYPTTTQKKVVLLRDFKGTFTVNCNAVIEARSYGSHVVAGTDCTKTEAGGIITISRPLPSTLLSTTPFANNSITGGTTYLSDVSGNALYGLSTGNNTNSTFLTISQANAYNSTLPFLNVSANTTTNDKITSNNNLFLNMSMANSQAFSVVGEDAKGYYVIDLDMAALDNMLTGFDISVVMRQADANGNPVSGTFPFSDEIFIGDLVGASDYWSHVTVIGDIKNNVIKIFVNGQYLCDAPGVAVRTGTASNVLGSATKVVAQGLRIELTRNNIACDFTEGDNVSFDNFAYRLFVDNNFDELETAIEAGDISTWSGYTNGRGGNVIDPIAVVDGVPYANKTTLELALIGEKTAHVEIISKKLTSLNVACNAVINTNGYNVNVTHSGEFTSTTEGNTITVSGHFVENMQSIVSGNATAIKDAIKYPANDNLLSYLTLSATGGTDTIPWGAEGGRGSALITNTDNGNVFYKEYLVGTAMDNYSKNGNDYVNYSFSKVDLTKENGYNKYVIVDFDFAYEGTLDNIAMQVITRGSGAYWATTQPLKNFGVPAGRFVHITAVYDYTNNQAVIFVNGNKTYTVAKGALTDAGATDYANGVTMGTSEFRVGSNSTSTIYLDNMYIRSSKAPTSNDTLATAITEGTTRAWNENIYNASYNMTDWPAIATVNGIKYSYAEDIQALLDKVDNAEIEFHRATSYNYTFSSPATVKTNGLDISYSTANGYQASYNNTNRVLTVTPTGEGKLTLNIGGVQVLNKTLPYGTDIRELLKEYGFGAASKTIAEGGNIYTGVTWSISNNANKDASTNTPTGYLNSDLTLTATGGTLSDKPFILLDANGAIVSNDYTSSALMNFFLTQADGTIILGSNWTVEDATGNSKSHKITSTAGTMNVCLNGYSIIDNTTGADHPFRIEVSSSHNVNFFGEGTLDFDKNISSRAIIYTAYNYTGTILFKNVDIDTSYTITYFRSGNAEFVGCDIDAYLVDAYGGGLFWLGENYNTGYSTNPMALTITNCDINHRIYDSAKDSAVIVHRVVSSGYNVDPKTTVIINNSKIITQSALVEAYRGHQSNTGVIDTNAAAKSNMTVYLNKVSLVAESLALGEIKKGSVIFYEDVRTNIEDLTCVSYIIELTKVKTSDGMTPYLYTSHDYGSVTWSNGNAELWASGSLPTHEVCKFDNATIVEKGQTYKYVATTSSAPIKLLADLTLSNEITFNFYIPTSQSGAKVYMDGKLITAGEKITFVELANADCYNYSISFSPEEAAKDFALCIVLSNGTTISRTVSVGVYAEALLKQINKDPSSYKSQKNKALLGAALNYIKAAGTYSGVNTDTTVIDKILKSCSTSLVTPTGTRYDVTALNNYFTGALINASTSSKFRFNVKSGADISDLKFYVDGVEKNYTVAQNGSYVELSLRAYEMTHDIVISVGGNEFNYNLYTYYAGLVDIANGTTSANQKEAVNAANFIKALYTYANVADTYLDYVPENN